MNRELDREWQEWLSSRPECVQALAAEFLPGDRYMIDDDMHYLIGYQEPDALLLTPYHPVDERELALNNIKVVCASHFRQRRH